MSRRIAFTLIETLVVIAIVAVVAAVLFPVIVAAKRKSYEPREEAQLRQIYVAVNLYEADFDHESPGSLVNLVPNYLRATMLDSPTDVRHDLRPAPNDWPANPWRSRVQGFPQDVALARSPFINSYLYLKTYGAAMPAGRKYEEFRNNPAVGLVAGIGLWTCSSSEEHLGCYYPVQDKLVDPGQPSPNLTGTYITVRTDGSLTTRRKPARCVGGHYSFEQLFLFFPDGCGPSSTGSG